MNKKVSTNWQISSFQLRDWPNFLSKAQQWAADFPLCTCMDSNDYDQDKYHQYDHLIGVGEEVAVVAKPGNDSFEQLKRWHQKHKDWLFGYLGYDLKNEIEDLNSGNKAIFDWPDLLFFQPVVVLEIRSGIIVVRSRRESPLELMKVINAQIITAGNGVALTEEIRPRMPKAYYLKSIEAIRQHIVEGDIYEMNFCQEFFVEDCKVDPLNLYQRLNPVSKAPFATFFRWFDAYVCCASPERFLQKRKNKLISQPIKGTIARGKSEKEDLQLQQKLHDSEKDRAENVMIVDLVRNDLARSCVPGSVEVEELFGIYPFEQVSHMISTVTGVLRNEVHFVDAIKRAFPMGSMTGAPKVMSMQLIEHYELSKRGVYSGAIGYITPAGDFDFNVVIRSLMYDAAKRYLAFQVGGAIVFDSVAEQEFEECLLKAKGMLRVLTGDA